MVPTVVVRVVKSLWLALVPTVVFKVEISTPSTRPVSVILLPLSVTPPIVLLPLADRLLAASAPANVVLLEA